MTENRVDSPYIYIYTFLHGFFSIVARLVLLIPKKKCFKILRTVDFCISVRTIPINPRESYLLSHSLIYIHVYIADELCPSDVIEHISTP